MKKAPWELNPENIARGDFSKFNRYMVFKRFLKYIKIGQPDECWEWTGSYHKFGYGQFKWQEENIHNAHVAAYVLFIGKRHGLYVCHSCDNPRCVNPHHLWLGTNKQNIQDMDRKGRAKRYDFSQRDQRGEKNCMAKLSSDTVRRMREIYAEGSLSYSKVAKKFGVSTMAAYRAIVGQSWKKLRATAQ